MDENLGLEILQIGFLGGFGSLLFTAEVCRIRDRRESVSHQPGK